MKTGIFLAFIVWFLTPACGYHGSGDAGVDSHDEDSSSSEEHERTCRPAGGAGECMWDADCLIGYVCTPGCYCTPREGIEGCECARDNECESPDHCIECKCQGEFPWCAMNSCLSDDHCSADGNICTQNGGTCVMDDRYDHCYCLCNP